MTTTFTSTQSFIVEYCCAKGCGIAFGMHRDHYDRLRAKPGTTFYCPNGHAQHYTGASETQKRKDAEARETALRDQLAAAIRDADQTRLQLLRDRQRFANGVCPCCNRSFENVRRHMESQHPDFAIDHTDTPTYRCSCGRDFDTLHGLRIHQGRSRNDGWDQPAAPAWRAHLTEVNA